MILKCHISELGSKCPNSSEIILMPFVESLQFSNYKFFKLIRYCDILYQFEEILIKNRGGSERRDEKKNERMAEEQLLARTRKKILNN